MYTDLVASDAYIQINKKLVKLFGIEFAAYWAVLVNIMRTVQIKKDTKPLLDNEGFFTVSRDYIIRETGLSLEKQYNCDSILVRLGVIEVKSGDRDKLQPDITRMTEIIILDDEKEINALMKKANLPKSISEKDARAAAKRDELVAKEEAKAKATQGKVYGMWRITDEQPIAQDETIKVALHNWVQSVYDSGKWLNRVSIEIFCNTIESYSTDTDVRRYLVDIAAANGYREINYAISVYEKTHPKAFNGGSPVKPSTPQKVAKGVSDINF